MIAPTQGAQVTTSQEVAPAPLSTAQDDDTSSRATHPPPYVRASQRHLPPSFRRPGATVDPAIVRRYAEMRAETDAQVRAFRLRHPPIFYMPDPPRATPQEPQQMQSEVATHVSGAEPTTAQVVASPPSAAQVVAPPSSTAQTTASQPIHAFTRPISSMLQTFAFDDTRDGYDDFTLV